MTIGLIALSVLLAGDVIEQAANGFTSRNSASMSAPIDEVFDALANELPAWWDVAHTYTGDARNLSLNATAGGCFCEQLPGGGSVQHLEVVYVEPDRILRFRGGLGPLQALGVDGSLTFSLEPAADETQVTLTYAVGGYYPGGLDTLAAPVDSVLKGQLASLKSFVEE